MAHTFTLGERVRVKVQCSCGDQKAINTFHYVVTSVVNAGLTDVQLANYFDDEFSQWYVPLIAENAVYDHVSVGRYWPTPPTAEEINNDSTAPGQVGNGPALPRQCCGIFTKTTRFIGRKYRGRAYVPFPGEGSNDLLGVPVAAYLTALGNLASEATIVQNPAVGVDGLTLEPILQAGGDPTAINYTLITGSIIRNRWATQRSRGSYGSAP